MKVSIRVQRDGFVLDVAFACAPGRTLAIVGPNGAGKSTLIEAVAGLLACEGSIEVGGARIDRLPPQARGVGVLFQEGLLFPTMSVRGNVAFAARARGLGRQAARARADEMLSRFGIAALADRAPGQVSGGQARLVSLARALASDPSCLLLDEPLAGLDASNRALVREQVATAVRTFAGPCVIVAHGPEDVEGMVDDIAILDDGRLSMG